MNSAFKVEHLKYKHSPKNEYIFDDLSCSIEQGSFTCIVGQNGSGKTTFVKLLAGILEPEEGSISRASDFSALVFQNPDNQFISNIVEEDVAFGPENLCFPTERIRTVVDEALKTVDMFEEKDRPISSLSVGEKQRVAIAGAMALSSDCIILDEPTSMLSASGSKSIIQYLLKLNMEKGTTIICVTQNPMVALASNRILIMDKGRFSADTNPKDFIMQFDKYDYCGIVLPESVKLVRLLNQNGYKIGLDNMTPELIVEEIQKKC